MTGLGALLQRSNAFKQLETRHNGDIYQSDRSVHSQQVEQTSENALNIEGEVE